jgi:hypothetical protein
MRYIVVKSVQATPQNHRQSAPTSMPRAGATPGIWPAPAAVDNPRVSSDVLLEVFCLLLLEVFCLLLVEVFFLLLLIGSIGCCG